MPNIYFRSVFLSPSLWSSGKMSLPKPDLADFKVGDVVCLGSDGEKGKIIDIYRPVGTYPMYKVHVMTSGNVKTAARHELVKGLPDEDFQDLFEAFQVPRPRPTSTASPVELLDDQPDNTNIPHLTSDPIVFFNQNSENTRDAESDPDYEMAEGPFSCSLLIFYMFVILQFKLKGSVAVRYLK